MENGRICEIIKQIKDLEKEKKEIQSNCMHKQTHIKFIEDSNNLRLFCKECELILGFPSQEEINEFLNTKKNRDYV